MILQSHMNQQRWLPMKLIYLTGVTDNNILLKLKILLLCFNKRSSLTDSTDLKLFDVTLQRILNKIK